MRTQAMQRLLSRPLASRTRMPVQVPLQVAMQPQQTMLLAWQTRTLLLVAMQPQQTMLLV
jgi:hypothetical protein